jgi:hypothetical protein
MNVDGLSGLVNRIIAWADRLQRRHGVLGFPYGVVKKYDDDVAGRRRSSLPRVREHLPAAVAQQDHDARVNP